jgi:hypothetical protein
MADNIKLIDEFGEKIIAWAKTDKVYQSPYANNFLCKFHEALFVAVGKYWLCNKGGVYDLLILIL